MKLRTRLILVLLLLSVVPLGAVTVYSYVSNLKVLQSTATREAELLAGELSARMELVTSELSDRVERLIDMPAIPVPDAPTTAPKPENATPPATTASTATTNADAQAASMLGEAAMLLERVELQGARGGGGGRGVGGGGANVSSRGTPAAGGISPANPVTQVSSASSLNPGRAGSSVAPGFPRPAPNRLPSGETGSTGATSSTGADAASTAPPRVLRFDANGQPIPNDFGRASGGRGRNGRPPTTVVGPQGAQPSTGAPSPTGAVSAANAANAAALDADHVVINVREIANDVAQKMMPVGGTGQWTPEMRQRFNREMGERLEGIQEGIKLSVAELQKKADQERLKAGADQKPGAPPSSGPLAPAATPPPPPTHRTAALAGNHLNVTVERNGQVRQADAQINLDNMLMTVFTTTKRDRGEVPFAVGKDGKLYTPTDADRQIVQTFGAAISPTGPVGTTVLADWVVVTRTDPTGSGVRFGIARPVGDSVAQLRKTTGRNAGLGLLFIALAMVAVVPISSRLTRNLSTLTSGVQQIARGDFRARVPVKSRDEAGALALAFNQMAEDLEAHQHALVGQERLKRELELGRQIQNDMLPHEPLRLGLTEVKGVSVPAREVGGDFFNYFALATGEVALLVGDVSGKGVGAALVMANVQATLRTRLAIEQDLTVITDAIDRDMEAASRNAYATLFLGILNPATKRLRFVNAGHHPQYVVRANGGLERMHSTGLPIGLLSGRGYTQGDVQLATGDFLFFYTDGMVEAENSEGEFFGADRLEAAIIDARMSSPDGGIDAVLSRAEQTVLTFRAGCEPFDDSTLMAVRIG